LIHPKGKEEMRDIFSYVKKHMELGDILYLQQDAVPILVYYQNIFNFLPEHCIQMKWDSHIESLYKNLYGIKRIWIISPNNWSYEIDDQKYLVKTLIKSGGKLLDTFSSTKARTYLFDLSNWQSIPTPGVTKRPLFDNSDFYYL
jgi:hypothetical protein